MTKGYLCIMAALGTGLSCGSASAQSQPQPNDPGAVASAVAALTASVDRAAHSAGQAGVQRLRVEVAGWSLTPFTTAGVEFVSGVRTPVGTVSPTPDAWRVVAAELHTDRLVAPRVIGPEVAIWGASGRLLENGAVIEQAVVSTRHHTVRAGRVQLTLHPYSVELIDVGTPVQRAE